MQTNISASSYKKLEQKSKLKNMFLRWFLYFVLIIFASYFITNPESAFTIGISYFPPLTPFMMILRLGTGTVEWIEILITAIIMIVSCWAMMKLSGKIFRTAILLYGKRATLKEIIHWVKA